MTLREIEYFLAVVDEGSFTRAARRVGVAQPSLSQQVRALETELGGQLIERLPRAVRLTAAGKVFVPHARAALAAAQRAARDARAALHLEIGELEIAAVRSVVVGLLPEAIRRWRAAHPHTVVHLHEFTHREALAEAVRSGLGDIAVGPAPSDWDGPVQSLGWQELVVVLSRQDPLSRTEGRLPLESLAEHEWVMFEHGHGLSELTRAACAQAGFQPRVVVHTSQLEAASRLAAAGIGAAVVPLGCVPAGLDAAVMRMRRPPGHELTAYTRGEWSPLATEFLRILAASPLPPKPRGARAVIKVS